LAKRNAASTIDLGTYITPHGIAWLPDGKRVIVSSEQTRSLVIVDVFGGKVERAIPIEQPVHLFTLSKDGHRCYTRNIPTGSVSLVDVDKGAVVKTATIGGGPEANDLTPDEREFWAGDSRNNRILVMSASSLDTLASMPAGDRPNRLHFTRDGRW